MTLRLWGAIAAIALATLVVGLALAGPAQAAVPVAHALTALR